MPSDSLAELKRRDMNDGRKGLRPSPNLPDRPQPGRADQPSTTEQLRFEEVLPLVEHPSMVIRGEHDSIVSQEWAEQVAGPLRSETVHVVRGWGHALNYSAPEQLHKVICSFLVSGPQRTNLSLQAALMKQPESQSASQLKDLCAGPSVASAVLKSPLLQGTVPDRKMPYAAK